MNERTKLNPTTGKWNPAAFSQVETMLPCASVMLSSRSSSHIRQGLWSIYCRQKQHQTPEYTVNVLPWKDNSSLPSGALEYKTLAPEVPEDGREGLTSIFGAASVIESLPQSIGQSFQVFHAELPRKL